MINTRLFIFSGISFLITSSYWIWHTGPLKKLHRHPTPQMARWGWWRSLFAKKGAVLTFFSGRLPNKQEIIFLLAGIPTEKMRQSQRGSEIQGIVWEWSKLRVKSEGLQGEGRQAREVLGPDISPPRCCRAEYILSVLYTWALVSERLYIIALLPSSDHYLYLRIQAFELLSKKPFVWIQSCLHYTFLPIWTHTHS